MKSLVLFHRFCVTSNDTFTTPYLLLRSDSTPAVQRKGDHVHVECGSVVTMDYIE